MNKNKIYLIAVSLMLVGCTKTSPTSQSTQSITTAEVTPNYTEIKDVSKLFETYAKEENIDFQAIYKIDSIQNRKYVGGWETSYKVDGNNIQFKYESYEGAIVTDYYLYDAEKDKMIYYLQNSTTMEYSFIEEDDPSILNFIGYIDYFHIEAIDWENDFQVDETKKVCVPKNNKVKNAMGKHIFGDNKNEYWENIEVHYNDGYITKVSGVSIYNNSTSYIEVTLTNHGYVSGSIKAPTGATKYIDPNKPFYKDSEDYSNNIALSNELFDALPKFTGEKDQNYTLHSTWKFVENGAINDTKKLEFDLQADKGNYEYISPDNTMPSGKSKTYLLVRDGFIDPMAYKENATGTYTQYLPAMSEYKDVVGSVYLDRVFLFGFKQEDLSYDPDGDYITTINEETANKYCKQLFFFDGTYGGLKIFLKDVEGTKVLDRIETSFFQSQDGVTLSFVKTYEFTNLNTTKISYPEGVKSS